MCLGHFADSAGSRAAAQFLRVWAPHHLADLQSGQGEVAVGEVWGEPVNGGISRADTAAAGV